MVAGDSCEDEDGWRVHERYCIDHRAAFDMNKILKKSRYRSHLHLAMHLDGLKQNCCNCGDSYDDSQKENVLNSQTGDATTDGSGTDSGITCCAKKFNFHAP
jgi:hypothetical protein